MKLGKYLLVPILAGALLCSPFAFAQGRPNKVCKGAAAAASRGTEQLTALDKRAAKIEAKLARLQLKEVSLRDGVAMAGACAAGGPPECVQTFHAALIAFRSELKALIDQKRDCLRGAQTEEAKGLCEADFESAKDALEATKDAAEAAKDLCLGEVED